MIRLAISIGGDSDTIACMAGAIAACCYEIPDEITEKYNCLQTDDLLEIKESLMNLTKRRKDL